MQLNALRKAGCWNIYEEKRSATRGKRPQLDLALLDLRKGDTLVVWKLDRLARNARELYALLDRVHAEGANFKSLQEQFDFTTPMGQFVLGILALVAQLEAQMTAHRTSAGIAALKATGASYGALPVLSKAKVRLLKKLRKLRRKGKRVWTIARLAARFGVSTATINNYLSGRSRPRT